MNIELPQLSPFLSGKTAVLLSDGGHNSGTYKPEVGEFVNRGWPISTVAFGGTASRYGNELSISAKELVEIGKEISSLTPKVTLYDDGQHEDMLAGDGVYANTYQDATANGPYLVTIDIDARTSLGSSIRRRLQESFQVGPIESNSFTISELLDLVGNLKSGKSISELPKKVNLPKTEKVL